MFNLQIINESILCLETGKWLSLEELIQKCSHPETKLDINLNLKQNEFVQTTDKKKFPSINPRTKRQIDRSKKIQSQKISDQIQTQKPKDTPVRWDFLSKVQINNTTLNFIAISLIIIIGFYLVACSIAPLVNLNNQTFRVIFTIVGGIPSILFYSKSQTNDKLLNQ